jgi:hypothetical protein
VDNAGKFTPMGALCNSTQHNLRWQIEAWRQSALRPDSYAAFRYIARSLREWPAPVKSATRMVDLRSSKSDVSLVELESAPDFA